MSGSDLHHSLARHRRQHSFLSGEPRHRTAGKSEGETLSRIHHRARGSVPHQRAIIVIAVSAASVLTASSIGSAAWTTATVSPPFTVLSAHIPQPAAPTVVTGSPVKIKWTEVDLSTGAQVHRYRVIRYSDSTAAVACDVSADQTSCEDHGAPANIRTSYTVTAVHGRHWVGAESQPSFLAAATTDQHIPSLSENSMPPTNANPSPANLSPGAQPLASDRPPRPEPGDSSDGTQGENRSEKAVVGTPPHSPVGRTDDEGPDTRAPSSESPIPSTSPPTSSTHASDTDRT